MSFDGKGGLGIERWGGNYTLGNLFYYVRGKLSKTVKISKQNNCKIESIEASSKNGWFTTARKLKLYSSASKKKKKATMRSGTRFKALRVTVSGNNYYLKIKTSKGTTGWLYFPSLKGHHSNSYYLIGGRYT